MACMASILVSLASAAAATRDITAGRALSLAGLAVGLVSVILGWRALARATGGQRRSRGLAALIVGCLGVAMTGWHLATMTGAIGTGSGKLGGFVALAVGLIGSALGGVAVGRARPA